MMDVMLRTAGVPVRGRTLRMEFGVSVSTAEVLPTRLVFTVRIGVTCFWELACIGVSIRIELLVWGVTDLIVTPPCVLGDGANTLNTLPPPAANFVPAAVPLALMKFCTMDGVLLIGGTRYTSLPFVVMLLAEISGVSVKSIKGGSVLTGLAMLRLWVAGMAG